MAKKKVIILGGGLAGLAAAGLILRKEPNTELTLIEKQPYLGGLASSIMFQGYEVPRYYHHVISSNTQTIKMLKRFGMDKGLEWKRIHIAIGANGEYKEINNVSQLFSFKYLSLKEKLDFLRFGAYVIFLMNPKKIPDSMDAKAWLKKTAGKVVTDKVFTPLYAENKFNVSLSEISAKQFANRLKEREVYDKFAYPKQGLGRLIDCLAGEIEKRGGRIITSAEIKRIETEKRSVEFWHKQKEKIEADYIISTIPIPEFLKLATRLPEDYKKNISKVRYCPAVCMAFAEKEFLDKRIYWLNLLKEPAQVLIQHSVLHDAYPFRLNWALRYGGSEEDIELSDAEITSKYSKSIRKYFPKAKIMHPFVSREKYAEPIYDKHYSEYAPKTETPMKGIFFSGIQVTFPKIRNMNSAIESGLEAGARVISELRKE
jgi:protoporphyrinogen oxidase